VSDEQSTNVVSNEKKPAKYAGFINNGHDYTAWCLFSPCINHKHFVVFVLALEGVVALLVTNDVFTLCNRRVTLTELTERLPVLQ
jgi:hypothetical protein